MLIVTGNGVTLLYSIPLGDAEMFHSPGHRKTTASRAAALRHRRKQAGFRRIELWLTNTEEKAIRSHLREMRQG